MIPPPPGVLMDPPAAVRRFLPAGTPPVGELVRFLVLLGIPAIALLALGLLAAVAASWALIPAVGLTALIQLEILWLVSRTRRSP